MSGDERAGARTGGIGRFSYARLRRGVPRVSHYLLRGVLSGGALACAGLVVVGLGSVAAPLPDRGFAAPAPAALAAPAALPDVAEPVAQPVANTVAPAATQRAAAPVPGSMVSSSPCTASPTADAPHSWASSMGTSVSACRGAPPRSRHTADAGSTAPSRCDSVTTTGALTRGGRRAAVPRSRRSRSRRIPLEGSPGPTRRSGG